MVEARDLLEGGAMTTRYYVEVHYRVLGGDREALDAHADELMDALDEEPNLVDPDVGMNYEKSTVDVCTMIDAGSEGDALNTALTAVRSVVHRIGTGTPGWERSDEQLVSGTVRLPDMADA
jgi:hypothetical protein